jgi:hypothetical protein
MFGREVKGLESTHLRVTGKPLLTLPIPPENPLETDLGEIWAFIGGLRGLKPPYLRVRRIPPDNLPFTPEIPLRIAFGRFGGILHFNHIKEGNMANTDWGNLPRISKKEAIELVGKETVDYMEGMEKKLFHGTEGLVSPEGCKVFPKRRGCIIYWYMKGYTPGNADINSALNRIRNKN